MPSTPDTAQKTTRRPSAPRVTAARGDHDARRLATASTAPQPVSSQLSTGYGATACCIESGAVSRIPAMPAIAMRPPAPSVGGASKDRTAKRGDGMDVVVPRAYPALWCRHPLATEPGSRRLHGGGGAARDQLLAGSASVW
ncbi:MAG: hypothetical protein WB808_08710 [Candidatus Dormiibacterota bacterium]